MASETVFKARFTGAEFKAMWEAVKQNHARLAACARHRFPPLVSDFKTKYRCDVCQGEANADYVMHYCAGFKAAGGDPRLVCANIDDGGE